MRQLSRRLAALLAALLLLAACETKTPEGERSAPEPPAASDTALVTVKTEEETYRAGENDPDSPVIFQFSGQLPVVSIENGEEQAQAVNAVLRADAEAFQNGREEGRVSAADVLEMARTQYREQPEFFTVFGAYLVMERTVSVVRNGGGVLSLLYSDFYDLAGAHPSAYLESRNFDLSEGALLTLDGLSPEPEAFRAFLVQSVLEQLGSPGFWGKEELDADSALFEGWEDAVPALLDSGQWYFDESGLTVFANAYDLGPYALGRLEFPIPYSQIAELIYEKYLY